jgi:hypothetical protein
MSDEKLLLITHHSFNRSAEISKQMSFASKENENKIKSLRERQSITQKI